MAETRETHAYATMLSRMVAAYGRRLGDGEPADLAQALGLVDQLDSVIGEAVRAMRDRYSYSWAEIASALGTTRQNAYQRWGKDRP